ncbi:MAG: iron-containing alcohol dehydrogenase [Lachnospiraceae bacterium]|nr:iron-containing alcohol dehydrogenase [Lachnospiraceae bacterium]MBQ6353458.1 iron-containing alcohol dehydrogenase [Lachnospiraceae bacterium]
MLNFTFYTPTRVVFGKDTEGQVGDLAKAYGAHKVLLHYGGKSAERSGLLGRVRLALEMAGVDYVELGGVVPNPHLDKVYEGIELCKKEGVDFILAVGGGSVIDSSKAICYGLAEPDKDVWELFDKTRQAKCFFPLAVVLTIAAAGSEMSNSCVITDEKTLQKRGYNNDIARPLFAIMNPELTRTLPDYQTESGCADIMMHTMERYFNNGGSMELTDGLSESLIRTVMKNAEILHVDPDNYDARAEVMWASSLSHNGLTGCGTDGGDWACHRMEHELGGMFDVTHGAGLAAIWGSWARFVYRDCLPRFVQFAVNVMDVKPGSSDDETALAGIRAMEAFYRRIGMPTNIKELGVEPTDEQIEEMAAAVAVVCGDPFGSAKKLSKKDVAEIYRKAR